MAAHTAQLHGAQAVGGEGIGFAGVRRSEAIVGDGHRLAGRSVQGDVGHDTKRQLDGGVACRRLGAADALGQRRKERRARHVRTSRLQTPMALNNPLNQRGGPRDVPPPRTTHHSEVTALAVRDELRADGGGAAAGPKSGLGRDVARCLSEAGRLDRGKGRRVVAVGSRRKASSAAALGRAVRRKENLLNRAAWEGVTQGKREKRKKMRVTWKMSKMKNQ